jgi:hypothetical protein
MDPFRRAQDIGIRFRQFFKICFSSNGNSPLSEFFNEIACCFSWEKDLFSARQLFTGWLSGVKIMVRFCAVKFKKVDGTRTVADFQDYDGSRCHAASAPKIYICRHARGDRSAGRHGHHGPLHDYRVAERQPPTRN